MIRIASTPTIIGRRELPPSDNHNPHAHGPPVNHVNAPNPTDTVQPIPWVSPPIPTDNPNHAHSSLADPIISTYNPWNAPHVLPEGSHGNR
jgi:hypothetical protein